MRAGFCHSISDFVLLHNARPLGAMHKNAQNKSVFFCVAQVSALQRQSLHILILPWQQTQHLVVFCA
jgi:hypothetical protein